MPRSVRPAFVEGEKKDNIYLKLQWKWSEEAMCGKF